MIYNIYVLYIINSLSSSPVLVLQPLIMHVFFSELKMKMITTDFGYQIIMEMQLTHFLYTMVILSLL